MFIEKEILNKPVYYSNLLNVEHFFTTRHLPIKENFEEIKNYLGVDRLIKPNQTHSDNIEVVDEKNEYPNCDSLILNRTNCAIYLNFADCTPVILYDEKNNIASIAHAGWRGTAKKIAQKTALKMIKEFNSKPENICVAIGPCISFRHFETYDEALIQLKNSVNNQDGLFNQNYADLKGINKRQLEEIGIKNIDVCPFCTIDNNDMFFSYRAENATKMRHSALIKL